MLSLDLSSVIKEAVSRSVSFEMESTMVAIFGSTGAAGASVAGAASVDWKRRAVSLVARGAALMAARADCLRESIVECGTEVGGEVGSDYLTVVLFCCVQLKNR